MSSKALLVGINDYPGAPLRGCIDDVTNAASLMVKQGVFNTPEIHLLTDRQATTDTIKDRLRWLVAGAAAGDRLLFWFSGHGTLLPLRDANGDMLSNECAICPVDFDWSPEHAITTSGFAEIFVNIPEGVTFQWVSDSCHSGDLARGIGGCNGGKSYRAPRQYPMPAGLAWRVETWRTLDLESPSDLESPRLFRALPAHLHGAFISGCEEHQTSADAHIDGRYCGAFSYYLLSRLRGDGFGVPMVDLRNNVNADLEAADYEQDPELHGDPVHLEQGFLYVF